MVLTKTHLDVNSFEKLMTTVALSDLTEAFHVRR